MIGISKASWIFSIILHGGLLALLILGPSLRPTVRPELPSGNVIQAEIYDASLLDLAPLDDPTGPTPAELERERLQQELDQQRIEELAQKQKDKDERDRLKLQQQDEEERVRLKAQADAKKKADELKQDQVRLKKIADDKKELARVELKKEEDRIKKEKEDAAREEQNTLAAKKEAERIKIEKEEALRKERELLAAKKEAERIEKEKKEKARLAKISADKEKKRRAAAKKKLDEQLAREEQMRQMMGVEDQRNKAVDNGLLAQYIAQIVAKVERNWNRPPGAKEGLSCTVKATQIPGGDVTSVKVVECNGDAVVQRSIEAAVFKASPLPEPADSTLFERNLVFIFEPK